VCPPPSLAFSSLLAKRGGLADGGLFLLSSHSGGLLFFSSGAAHAGSTPLGPPLELFIFTDFFFREADDLRALLFLFERHVDGFFSFSQRALTGPWRFGPPFLSHQRKGSFFFPLARGGEPTGFELFFFFLFFAGRKGLFFFPDQLKLGLDLPPFFFFFLSLSRASGTSFSFFFCGRAQGVQWDPPPFFSEVAMFFFFLGGGWGVVFLGVGGALFPFAAFMTLVDVLFLPPPIQEEFFFFFSSSGR